MSQHPSERRPPEPYLRRPEDLEGLYRWREAAVRSLPAYRDSWATLAEQHGTEALRAALAELREPRGQFGAAGLSQAARDLLDLSSAFFMERGPVDPDDDDDFGWGWSTESTFAGKAIRASKAPLVGDDTWVPALVDLSASKALLVEEIQRLRDEVRLRRTRAKGRRAWDDDLGWRTAFHLLRTQAASGRSGADLGREAFVDRLPDDEAGRANLANKLLRCAKEARDQVEAEIRELRSALEVYGGVPVEQERLLENPDYARALGRRLEALGPFWLSHGPG